MALGSALALPALLRSQIRPGVQEAPAASDSLRVDDSTHLVTTPTGITIKERREKKVGDLELIRPPALAKGSTVAIVAPASGVSRGEVLDAAATLRNLGFNVKIGKYLTKGFGYLAGTDEERAEDLMSFVLDPEVNCIMAIRGGYGVMRILPLIDFEAIRAHPKVIIGYSDITALVNAIYQRSRMIAFHGPVASSMFDPYTLDSFRRTVMTAQPAGEFKESDEFRGTLFSEAHANTVISGKAQGRLVGGNLSLVTAVMGTSYEVDMRENILFLEEVSEEPYHIDRMLTQLAISGKLGSCAGVALGRFNKCEAHPKKGEFQMSLSIEQVVRGILEPLKIPTVYGLSIGHIKSKLTVPVGALATLDADAKTLRIDEAAVV